MYFFSDMSNLITLKSSEGQHLLGDTRTGNGLLQPILHSLFKKQLTLNTCGVQSSALILAAKDIGTRLRDIRQSDVVPQKDMSTRYDEVSLLGMPETSQVCSREFINKKDGLALIDVCELLKAHGLQISMHLASEATEDEFRQHAKEVLQATDSSSGIIVNYHMATLGQSPPYGHHSPLGGYHEETDRFLVLDVWKDTEECWASTGDIYRAMNTVDDDSGKTRGYIIIR